MAIGPQPRNGHRDDEPHPGQPHGRGDLKNRRREPMRRPILAFHPGDHLGGGQLNALDHIPDRRFNRVHERPEAENRPDHVAYLKAQGDQLVAAGPTTSDDGAAMTGSLLILDFAGRAEAEAFAAADPYAKAGLFDSVTIKPGKKVLPAQ